MASIEVERDAIPYLYVNTTVLLGDDGLVVYAVDVQMKQKVNRLNWLGLAATWETGALGYVGQNRAREVIRNAVKDKVDEFLNDYLTANPR